MNSHNAKLCMKKFKENISQQQAAETEKKLKSVPDDRVHDIRQIELISAKKRLRCQLFLVCLEVVVFISDRLDAGYVRCCLT